MRIHYRAKGARAALPALVMIGIVMLIGVFLLVFGIRDTLQAHQQAQGYEETQGRLVNYTLANEAEYDPVRNRHTSATYYLTYLYTVDGETYTVTTDYSTGSVPEIGSTREILYNPDDPGQAQLKGLTGNTFLLFMGAFFFVIPLFMLILILSPKGEKKNAPRVNGQSLACGLIFFFLGLGSVWMAAGEFSWRAVWALYTRSFNLFLLIPLLMIGVGVFLVVANLLPTKKSEGEEPSDLSEDP